MTSKGTRFFSYVVSNVNCDVLFSRWLRKSEAAQWFGWKNREFGGWEWWEPCYLAQGLKGVQTKAIWNFRQGCWGIGNHCQRKIKVCLWKDGIHQKKVRINLRDKSLQSTWASSTIWLTVSFYMSRSRIPKSKVFWLLGDLVRSSIFQNVFLRVSDPRVCGRKYCEKPPNGTWKLVVKRRCVSFWKRGIFRFHLLHFWGWTNPIEFHINYTCDKKNMPGDC